MKRLLFYMKQQRVRSILAPLFKMLEALFELLVPLVVARMIDRGITGEDRTVLLASGIWLILLGVVGFFSAITAQYLAARAATSVGTAIRSDLFRHIMGLGYREIDMAGTSSLVTRMTSDVSQVQTGINMFLRLFMRSPFVVFGAVVMAGVVEPRMLPLFLVTVAVLLLVVFAILLFTMPLYQKVQKALDGVVLTARENLSGVRVIRAFCREGEQEKRFDDRSETLFRAQIFVGKLSGLMGPLTLVIVDLATVYLIRVGGNEVSTGLLSTGQVIALVNYMSQILVELVKLANLTVTLSRAFASLARVNAVFSMTPSPYEAGETTTGTPDLPENDHTGLSVTFENVSFTYEGAASPALRNISFHADGGSTVGVIGGTGSGKSTLVSLIPRFYAVNEGNILVNGNPIGTVPVSRLRESIGIVPQRSVLFRGTLRENLSFGNGEPSDEVLFSALRDAQAEDFVSEKGEGLDLGIEQGGRNLSGGQKQRLCIARALVRHPGLLILDDSASALDYATDARLRRSLRKIGKDTTVFLVSQRVSAVRSADLILVLDDGLLVGKGTHDELLRSCPTYREICRSQLKEKEESENVG